MLALVTMVAMEVAKDMHSVLIVVILLNILGVLNVHLALIVQVVTQRVGASLVAMVVLQMAMFYFMIFVYVVIVVLNALVAKLAMVLVTQIINC